MSFTMDDVTYVLQMLRECDDCQMDIDTGELKISIRKGDVADYPASSRSFSATSTARLPEQTTAQPAAPTAPAPAEVPASAEAPVAAATVEAPKGEEAIPEGLVPVTASVTSVFYRKPRPDEPPFVEVGSEVEEDSVLCLLEVMKCYRSVTAGVKGRVEKILAESGQLVEYGTVIFLIRPG